MRKTPFIVLSTLALAMVAACSPPSNQPIAQAPVAVTNDQAVAASLGAPTRNTASLTFAAPHAEGYDVLAAVHRWLMADIYEYRVQLNIWDGSGYVTTGMPAALTVPQKVSPKTSAVFRNLPADSKFRATVQAWGVSGGTAATTQLNINDTAAYADYDFTGNTPNDSQSQAVRVLFDTVTFAGTGTVTFANPSDGTFASPASITATAE